MMLQMDDWEDCELLGKLLDDDGLLEESSCHSYSVSSDYAPNHVNAPLKSSPRMISAPAITLNDAVRFPMYFIEAFNVFSINRMSELCQKYIDKECICNMSSSFDEFRGVGWRDIVDFHAMILEKYPDGVVFLKDFRIDNLEGFRVVRCKMTFKGTKLLNGGCFECSLNPSPAPELSVIEKEFMVTKDQLSPSDVVSVIMNVVNVVYIDNLTNKIQSFRQMTKIKEYNVLSIRDIVR